MIEALAEFRRDQLLTGSSVRYVGEVAVVVRAMERAIGPAENVTEGVLRDYVTDLLTTPATGKTTVRKPNTVARIVVELRCFFRWLEDTGRIAVDPAAEIPTPRHHDRLVPPLEPHELTAFLAAAKRARSPLLAARNYALAIVAYDTALRLSELLSLEREDVEGAEHFTVFGKGARHRTIPLNEVARDAITDYLNIRDQRPDGRPALWIDQDGQSMTASAAQNWMKRIRNRLGMKSELTWHNIRRTSLTDMALSQMPYETRKVIGGHSTDSAAQRYSAMAGLRGALDAHRRHSPANALMARTDHPTESGPLAGKGKAQRAALGVVVIGFAVRVADSAI